MKIIYLKKENTFKGVILFVAAIAVFFSACKKHTDEKNNTEKPTTEKSNIDTTKLSTTPISINPIANANAAYDGFLRAFLVKADGQTYIVDGLNKRDRAYFWGQAFMITGLADAYEKSPSPARKQLINDLLTSFLVKETSDWSWNSWTDDIAWATIACMRGYKITGNTAFRDAAVKNWNFAFNRGWDNVVGGGLWENMDKYTKAALANNPMIISGTFIYESNNDVDYLNKCKQIYAWVRSSGLYNTNTGVVNEAIVNDGSLQASDNAYNTGSFINAATAMYKITKESQYLNDAVRSADYIVNKFGVMNVEGDGCVRGIAKLARENNMGSKYYPWLVRQCIASWNNRLPYSNITSNNWRSPTGAGEQFAMQCISAVTVQSVTPEAEIVNIPNGTYRLIARHNGEALSTVANGTDNNTGLQVAGYSGGTNQQWTLTGLGDGFYKLIGLGSGKSINVSGNSGDNNATLVLWDYNGDGNEKIYFTSSEKGYYTMYFVNSGKAVSAGDGKKTGIVQWDYTGANHQQWQFQAP